MSLICLFELLEFSLTRDIFSPLRLPLSVLGVDDEDGGGYDVVVVGGVVAELVVVEGVVAELVVAVGYDAAAEDFVDAGDSVDAAADSAGAVDGDSDDVAVVEGVADGHGAFVVVAAVVYVARI